MNSKKIFVLGLMIAIVLGSLGAQTAKPAKSAPVYVTTSITGLGTPVLAVTVDTPQSIIDWFEAHGMAVDSVGTSLESMPVSYRNELRKLFADNKYSDELRKLAVDALKIYLTPSVVETVSTTYGPFTWTVSYNNEDKERLVAPHDHERNISDW